MDLFYISLLSLLFFINITFNHAKEDHTTESDHCDEDDCNGISESTEDNGDDGNILTNPLGLPLNIFGVVKWISAEEAFPMTKKMMDRVINLYPEVSNVLMRTTDVDSMAEAYVQESGFDQTKVQKEDVKKTVTLLDRFVDQVYFASTITLFTAQALREKVNDVFKTEDIMKSFTEQTTKEDVNQMMDEWKQMRDDEKIKIEDFNTSSSSSDTCFDQIGCFPTQKNCMSILFGWQNYVNDIEYINTSFLFFNQSVMKDPDRIYYTQLTNDTMFPIDKSKLTTFIIHGFNSWYDEEGWMGHIKNLILEKKDENIICIDWSKGASGINYQRARGNTRVVGAQITRLIKLLHKNNGLDLDKVLLLGHSLGAHIMGYAGKDVQKRMDGKKVARILGLDPAGPCFGWGDVNYDPNDRLSHDDAKLVEAVHTNSAWGGLGIDVLIGHFDYFPNGGKSQPGCEIFLNEIIMPFRILDAYWGCSHSIAHSFVSHNLDKYGSCQMIGYAAKDYQEYQSMSNYNCDDWGCSLMGLGAQFSESVTDVNQIWSPKITEPSNKYYFLDVNHEAPHCLYVFRIKIFIDENDQERKGMLEIKLEGNNSKTLTIQMSDFFEPGKSYSKLTTIPESMDESLSGNPAPFNKVDITYHTTGFRTKDSPNVTLLMYDYLSDINPDVRKDFSGSISMCGQDIPVEDDLPEVLETTTHDPNHNHEEIDVVTDDSLEKHERACKNKV